ncbi:hypothetical protein MP638_006248 [Amoeboaphelidium occidentale]|nr:hypothetical protein MP638_006248 [Amoeboaphelidium occidentale]
MTMINNNKSSDDDDNEVLPDLPFKFSPLRETKTPSLLPLKKVSKRKLNLPPDSQKEIMAEYSTVKKKDFSLDNLLKEKKKSIKKQKGIDSYYKEIINSSKNNNNNNNDNNNNNGGGGGGVGGGGG